MAADPIDERIEALRHDYRRATADVIITFEDRAWWRGWWSGLACGVLVMSAAGVVAAWLLGILG